MSRIRPELLMPPSPTTEAALPPDDAPAATARRCCKSFCFTPASHRLIILALPDEGSFSFDNFYTCTEHIPSDMASVFPGTQQFSAMYPEATGFQIVAQPL